MKKTKIICTMGPNTDDREMLKSLIENGMDIARFNFSHGDYAEHRGRLTMLKEIREELNIPVAALLDTQGPEIRTGLLKDGNKISLEEGNTITLTTREVEGDETIIHINYAGLAEDVEVGNRILIDDGLIELEIQSIEGQDIQCLIKNGGELGMRKGVNVPNVRVKLPALTDKDIEDILFGIDNGYDFIAASFVRNADCILEIKQILSEHHADLAVIAKIENAEGVENIDAIIEASDGIMVARGDLGVEIPAEEVPYLQKMIIAKCSEACKPVITATQMLDSMMHNPRPTRAEVTDVANAVYDGTDAVMLSGETAVGKYPIEALKMMGQIAEAAESHIEYDTFTNRKVTAYQRNVSNVVCHSSVITASELGASAILVPSLSSFTTRMISKWRPRITIVGMSPSISSVRKMQLYWGVKPILAKRASSTDELVDGSVELAKQYGIAEVDDIIVIIAGVFDRSKRNAPKGDTNMMRVVIVED